MKYLSDMKITDNELMRLIWINQLELLPRAVIHKYIGGRIGLASDDSYWYSSLSSERRINRRVITNVIGQKQLLTRIRRLIVSGHLTESVPGHAFFINIDKAREAFRAARTFWKSKGVPEGVINGKQATIKKPVFFEDYASECRYILFERFAQERLLDVDQ